MRYRCVSVHVLELFADALLEMFKSWCGSEKGSDVEHVLAVELKERIRTGGGSNSSSCRTRSRTVLELDAHVRRSPNAHFLYLVDLLRARAFDVASKSDRNVCWHELGVFKSWSKNAHI